MVFMALKPHCSKKARFLPPKKKLLISLERVEEELTLERVEITLHMTLMRVKITLHQVKSTLSYEEEDKCIKITLKRVKSTREELSQLCSKVLPPPRSAERVREGEKREIE